MSEHGVKCQRKGSEPSSSLSRNTQNKSRANAHNHLRHRKNKSSQWRLLDKIWCLTSYKYYVKTSIFWLKYIVEIMTWTLEFLAQF